MAGTQAQASTVDPAKWLATLRAWVPTEPLEVLVALINSLIEVSAPARVERLDALIAHRERRGDGCVIAALGGEIPRQGAAIRHSFTDAVRAIMKRIASLMPGRRKSEDEALAIVATMVGALTLARAVDDPELSDRILAAARTRLASR